MSKLNPLSEAEERALATAVLLARSGAGFTAKPEDVPACESLVKRDYLEPIEGEERGFVLTRAFAAAVGITAAQQAERGDELRWG
jgi:hypothetical protein